MDRAILTFFNQTLAHPLLDVLMVGLTYGLWLLPVVGAGLLPGRQRRVGLAILAALAASLALATVFQFLALRPRPDEVRLVLPMPNFPSYPSGHAVAAFASAAVLSLAYRQAGRQALAWMAACSISLSRVYLGHHYPSDILAGAVLGAAIGAACYGKGVARRGGWRWLLWPQLALALLATHMAYLDILPLYLLRWPLADKVLHLVLFGGIVFWLNLWLDGRAVRLWRWAIPLAILIPLALALLEEGLQHLSPLRTASLADLLSDLAGMLLFWWASQRLRHSISPQEQPCR